MSEQKVLNYLYWLRDRGQSLVFAPKEGKSLLSEPHEMTEPSLSDVEIPKLRQREKIPLLFVTPKPLLEDEAAMVIRIASAIGARSDQIRVVLNESLADFDPDFIIALDQSLNANEKTLTIPHPSEMLKDPQLKLSAWENLQKLKGRF